MHGAELLAGQASSHAGGSDLHEIFGVRAEDVNTQKPHRPFLVDDLDETLGLLPHSRGGVVREGGSADGHLQSIRPSL